MCAEPGFFWKRLASEPRLKLETLRHRRTFKISNHLLIVGIFDSRRLGH